ncbi:MAG: homocysteine S-methyltransferase family protein [Endomicrobiales bacterium]|nr:homocysteine S-methyltransferase family protein [Endomicrobiales bacterium]
MNKTDFRKLVSERILILDGAMGTELQKRGFLKGVNAPEELNVKFPERIQEIQKDYFEAGSDIVIANTFGANRHKLADYGLENRVEELNVRGIEISRQSAKKYNGLVAGDIGPVGAYLAPLGKVAFDEAYEIFSEQAKALQKAGADLIIIETMAEIREVKAALLASKDNFSGPVAVQMTFTEDGTAVTGTDVLAFLSVAEAMGADAVGMNCSVGPKALAKLAKILCENTSLPVSFKPNAGMPKLVNRETVFPGTPEEFAEAGKLACSYGVNLIGGCCGTGPDFIRALAKQVKGGKPVSRKPKEKFFLSSRTKAIDIASVKDFIKIGERINPTNRKKFQEELLSGNFTTLRREAKEQVKSGAAILDINLGLPGADEKTLMSKAVEEIQEVVSVPLCLDSSSVETLEAGLKACAGKCLINSVNGEKEKLEKIIPLAKRYGAGLIGLVTDEKGIPKTAGERLEIAKRIIEYAQEHGIPSSEIVIDYLTLAASAMPGAIKETLAAIKESKQKWPNVKTVLGISNVSFGLPSRQILNATFLNIAKEEGLDMAILDPYAQMSLTINPIAKDLLLGEVRAGSSAPKDSLDKFIQEYGYNPQKPIAKKQVELNSDEKLYSSVVEGNKEEIKKDVEMVLKNGKPPLSIANDILIAALNEVGAKFNSKEYFLPQVIRSAEAAQSAFEVIKPLLKKDGSASSPYKIVLATVQGDVHDIGKNIVAAVLESHGWEVIDLGKNVGAKAIVDAAKKENAPLIGLSALMTTTMIEMEKVVKERDAAKISAKIIVGGAPVTEKYAKEIGADGYGKDAVEAAKTASKLAKL